jgi:hypothetical protein
MLDAAFYNTVLLLNMRGRQAINLTEFLVNLFKEAVGELACATICTLALYNHVILG